MRKVAVRPDLMSLIQPSVSDNTQHWVFQEKVLDIYGLACSELSLLSTYLFRLLSWHMPRSMRLCFLNLMLSYLILDYQFLIPQGKFWLTELLC